MINSFTTSNYTNLKGFIAELVSEFHFSKINYNIIPLGNEKISGLLPSISTLFKGEIVENGTYDSNTFNILRSITQDLPDFVIWKLAPSSQSCEKQISVRNILKISFVEVKYRQSINGRELRITKNNDELKLFRYITYIRKNSQLRNNVNSGMDKIDFYVYLLTCENKKHKILFGKVFESSADEFRLTLYDTVNKDFNVKTGNKWDEFNEVSNFICLDSSRKLNELFDKNFIYSLKNKDEASVRSVIFERLEQAK